jgi:hypothetical protein
LHDSCLQTDGLIRDFPNAKQGLTNSRQRLLLTGQKQEGEKGKEINKIRNPHILNFRAVKEKVKSREVVRDKGGSPIRYPIVWKHPK